MLTVIAALVPTVAGLVVASSALVEYSRRSHAARVWERVRAREDASYAEIEALGLTDYAERDRLRAAPMELRQRLIELNGFDPMMGTYKLTAKAMEPSYPPAAEQWRQWLLLSSSAISLFLLALSAAV